MLDGSFAANGYDWWWHSFTGIHRETGEEKAFFIEFFLCNPALGGDEPVLGQLPENKKNGRKPSYLCVKAGAWGKDSAQLNRYFGWNSVTLGRKAPFSVFAEDCSLSETATRGSITITEETAAGHPEYMTDAGSMSWDLQIRKKIPFHVGYGAGAFLRKIKAFEMYWHAEGMKTLYKGTVTFNGQVYEVKPETCYGYADKNWGSNFTSPWVWLASNNLYSNRHKQPLRHSAFDIGGGNPKVFGIPLGRHLLGAFCYEGEEFEFNFSKFWRFPRTRFEMLETPEELIWKVKQGNLKAIMLTEMHCKKEDMIFINYEAPNGEKKHDCLWNGGNATGTIKLYRRKGIYCKLIDDISVRNGGCEFGVFEEDLQ